MEHKFDFSAYTVRVSRDPSYYGSTCTQVDAHRIAYDLSRLIESEFPGIAVETGEGKTTGPDAAVVWDIDQWISENWTAAL